MKNGRTGSNYVEPPDDSRMEGYKTNRTDAGSMCCTGMQNVDLKNGNTELSDIESAEAWSYPEVENCAEDSIPEGAEPGDGFIRRRNQTERDNPEGSRDSPVPGGAAQEGQTQDGQVQRGQGPHAAVEEEQKTLFLPDVISMTKYFCDHYKLALYSYLNHCLRDGSLARTVGFSFHDTWLNKRSCDFPAFSYWKIDRESFYTDVSVHLSLKTGRGIRHWDGTLVIWCSFPEDDEDDAVDDTLFMCPEGHPAGCPEMPDDGFIYMIEDLVPGTPNRNDYWKLSPFLVPYYRNEDMDHVTERIWMKYIPEALGDYRRRDAFELAEKMGLRVETYPLHKREGVAGILFFQDDEIAVLEKDTPPGSPHRIIRIPGRTIVINENLRQHNYPQFDIYHECIHYEEHYLFYRLQGLRCNDAERIRTIEVPIKTQPKIYDETVVTDSADDDSSTGEKSKDGEGKKKAWNDPVYFMEKQANRGAFGLMMPAASTHEMIRSECGRARKNVLAETGHSYRHSGELYEDVGKEISRRLHVPHFRIRARLIQLGYIEARGSLNYADRKLIQPFAFDKEAWREMTHTFVVNGNQIQRMITDSEDFCKVMESGEYIYADGHIVKNGERYVRQVEDRKEGPRLLLTDWANRHVDECCLRFVRVYVQTGVGRYEFGRMYYDAEFIARTRFYVNDFLNREKLGDMDDIDARMLYRQRFPKQFIDAFQYLRVSNGISMKDMADKLGMNQVTLKRWIESPAKYRNEDFLTAVSLVLKLPDWISRLLFKRAAVFLDEDSARHMALDYILRVQSCDGIKAANEYLTRHGFNPLTL